MLNNDMVIQILDAGERRRAERRNFLRSAGQATIAAGGLSLLAACGDDNDNAATPTPTPTPTPSPTATSTDQDVLNFALNLEYLEAQFYSFAVNGVSIDGSLLTGTGTPGAVAGGRKVTFTDPIVRQYAREIAADELAHVKFLRTALGSAAVAQPAIDVSASATGAFTAAARAAGVVGGNEVFDPYADDNSFLLGAFIFEDVGVSAYKGASPLITNKTYLEAAAGILAAEAYHAGLVRTVLYAKGIETPALRTNAGKISDARDSLDGTSDDDQGITIDPVSGGDANIVPTDGNALVYSRSTGQVLNIVYLNKAAVVGGGFFPVGVNGTFKTSAASG